MADIHEFLSWYGEMAWRDTLGSKESQYEICYFPEHKFLDVVSKPYRDVKGEDVVFSDGAEDDGGVVLTVEDLQDIANEFGNCKVIPEHEYEGPTEVKWYAIPCSKSRALEFVKEYKVARGYDF